MIYVTGDTHGTYDLEKLRVFAAEHKELTKKDYVIIAGDFGAVWSPQSLRTNLALYEALPFTTLFVDGNHENFDMLDEYPVREWMGGKVHFITEDIIHLTRGQVFLLEGKRIFTFGGATSVDRMWRKPFISWWPNEIPSDKEIQEAEKNLNKVHRTVDYIITHSCGEEALSLPPLSTRDFQTDVYYENRVLSAFEKTVTYKHWYFGHYHMDARLNDKTTALYQWVLPLQE